MVLKTKKKSYEKHKHYKKKWLTWKLREPKDESIRGLHIEKLSGLPKENIR